MKKAMFHHRFTSVAVILAHQLKQNNYSVAAASSFLFSPHNRPSTSSYCCRTSLLSSNTDHIESPTSSMSSYEYNTPSLIISQFLCLDDNYGYLVHNKKTGETVAIDTASAEKYKEELKRRGWTLTDIWNTHHHWDHTGGNLELKEAYKAKISGDRGDKDRIPGIDVTVSDGDVVSLGDIKATVIDTGGHSNGHIAFHFPSEECVFTGDSLFVLGCGRMFEGTPDQFWASLKRLRSLPPPTQVFCGHEYTMSNAKFASSVEPHNVQLQSRVKVIQALRSENKPTVPSTMGEEIETNPFLRGDVSEEIRNNVNAAGLDDYAEVFKKIRHAKDTFRG